jgi:acyl-CoA thioester hydrolase
MTARLPDPQPLPAAPTPYALPVRVYYEDTDAGGVVYYANYLRFMERARTEWLRGLGFTLEHLAREHGVLFVVHRVEIDYRRPARLQDDLAVTVVPEAMGGTRLAVRQQVLRGSEVVTEARVQLVCVGTATIRPARIPAPLAHALETPT